MNSMKIKLLIAVVLAVFLISACGEITGQAGRTTKPQCSDKKDNTDRDLLKDYPNDPGCVNASDNNEIDGMCDDNVDDASDADSLPDGSDPGCSSTTDSSEIDGQCDDKLDNDADGMIDYPNDPGCTSYSDSSEYGTAQCDDGSDNDGDTKTDAGSTETKDSKCASLSDNDESPKDFCNDTDGQNKFILGTVTGDDEGVPFSDGDVCINSTTVQEYYCGTKSQDYAPLSIPLSCSSGNSTNSTCSGGRCI